MSAVDPKLCRELAKQCGYHSGLNPTEKRQAGEQLTAAADLAERVLTEERIHDVVASAVDDNLPTDMNLEIAVLISEEIATRAAKELAGAVVDPAQRETDLREAVLYGCRFVAGRASIDEDGDDPIVSVPSTEDCEDLATGYAHRKAARAVVGLSAEEREMLDAFRADPSLLAIARNRLLGGAQ